MNLLSERCEWLKVPLYDPGDPYSVLGVQKNASNRTIMKAFRGIAKKYHPDLLPHDLPPWPLQSCHKYFSDAVAAKGLLLDPNQKRLYDEYGFTGARYSNPSNLLSEAKKLLSDIFDAVCKSNIESEARRKDLIQEVVGVLKRHKEMLGEEANQFKAIVSRYEVIISRIHTDGDCFITRKAKENLGRHRQLQKDKVGQMMVADKAAKLILEYRYDFDKAPAGVLIQDNRRSFIQDLKFTLGST